MATANAVPQLLIPVVFHMLLPHPLLSLTMLLKVTKNQLSIKLGNWIILSWYYHLNFYKFKINIISGLITFYCCRVGSPRFLEAHNMGFPHMNKHMLLGLSKNKTQMMLEITDYQIFQSTARKRSSPTLILLACWEEVQIQSLPVLLPHVVWEKCSAKEVHICMKQN